MSLRPGLALFGVLFRAQMRNGPILSKQSTSLRQALLPSLPRRQLRAISQLPQPLRPSITPISSVSLRSAQPHLPPHRVFTSSPRSLGPRPYYGGSNGRPGGRPFWTQLRWRLESLPGMYLIFGMIGINVLVFFAWQYAFQSATRFHDYSLLIWLRKNMTVSELNLTSGRLWTLITSSFAHEGSSHIFVNCLGLYFIAPGALAVLGNTGFLALYLIGGVASSITALVWNRASGDQNLNKYFVGASGAIYSTLAFYGFLYPTQQILLFLMIPMPMWIAVSGIFAYDLYEAIRTPNSTTSHAGHVGGIVAGLLMGLRMRRGFPRLR